MPCAIGPTASTHMPLRNFIEPSVEPAQDPCGVRRRRAVVTATLVVGTAILAGTLAAPEGSGWFYALGLLAAVTWIIGAVLSGPIPMRRQTSAVSQRLEIVASLLVAATLFGAFLAAKVLADYLPLFSGSVASVLATADAGPRALGARHCAPQRNRRGDVLPGFAPRLVRQTRGGLDNRHLLPCHRRNAQRRASLFRRW